MALPEGTFFAGQIVPATGRVRQVGGVAEAIVVRGGKFPPTGQVGGCWVYIDSPIIIARW
jgi:hypothetical protein